MVQTSSGEDEAARLVHEAGTALHMTRPGSMRGSRKGLQVMNMPNKKSRPGAIGGVRRLVGAIGHAAKVQASEVALMASFAANAPLRIVGRRLDPPPVRCPRQREAHPCMPCAAGALLGTKSTWSWSPEAYGRKAYSDAISYAPFGISVEQVATGPSPRCNSTVVLKPGRTKCIWSDTAWAGSSSHRPRGLCDDDPAQAVSDQIHFVRPGFRQHAVHLGDEPVGDLLHRDSEGCVAGCVDCQALRP